MKTLLLFFSCILACCFPETIEAQQTIDIEYNAENNSLNLTKIPKKVKSNTTYTLVLKQVNSAHTVPLTEVTTSRYVSDIPDILRSIYPGIPNDAAGMNFPDMAPEERSIYVQATQYYRELSQIQRISDDLYAQTRFEPNIPVANAKKQELFQVLGVNSLQEAYARAVQAVNFLVGAQEIYRANLANANGQAPQVVAFLEEYATIKTYNDKINGVDYANMLNFIAESEQAQPSMTITSFTATGDVVDVALQLLDTYTNTTLLEQSLSFPTYANFSFDFSTGFFYNNLVQPEYYLPIENDNASDKAYIQEEDKPNTDVSIGALGHFTYKFSPEWRAGLALGAAISPFDGNLRYLLGPTIIWGGQKQLSLTFGLALAQMDELSRAVLRDEVGAYLPPNSGGIPTVNKLKKGFFVGITYNLTNTKQP